MGLQDKGDSKGNIERYPKRIWKAIKRHLWWNDLHKEKEQIIMSMQGFFQNHNGVSGTLRFTVTSERCKDTFLNGDLYGKVYMA